MRCGGEGELVCRYEGCGKVCNKAGLGGVSYA